jgi:hypothetical protein
MAKAVTHISIFLASPGDVIAEREIAFEMIHEWNDIHTQEKSASLQIKTWQAFAHPELGQRPQAVINRQVLDESDIVIGIFWTRFGSPTGMADSGTEEEIRRSLVNNKPVLLYFSDVPSSSTVDDQQYKKVESFRDEFRNTGLIWSYTSHEQFRDYLRRHLARAVQTLLTRLRSERIETASAGSSPSVHIQNNEGIAANTIHTVIYKPAGKKRAKPPAATGTIGSDMFCKNYVGYLVRTYNNFLKIGRESFGDTRNVSYSFLSTRVIQVFKSPANDLPLTRFEEVVDFIKEYLDDSIVGRNNHKKGWRSYESFDEFAANQVAKKTRRKKKPSD